jgi:DNA-binding NarL/FixJ family response regulator
MAEAHRVVVFVPDLMDRSKVQAAVEAEGGRVDVVSDPADLPAASEGADGVIVDLGRPGVLEVLGEVRAPSVGFGRHDDTAALDAALAAGCDQVLPRSTFFRGLDRIVAAHLG